MSRDPLELELRAALLAAFAPDTRILSAADWLTDRLRFVVWPEPRGWQSQGTATGRHAFIVLVDCELLMRDPHAAVRALRARAGLP